MEKIAEEIKLLIRSRYPVIYLLTYEEDRAEAMLKKLAGGMKKKLVTWAVTADSSANTPSNRAVEMLSKIINTSESSIFMLRDFHPYLETELVIRKMRDVVADLSRSQKTIVIVSPSLKIPMELEKDITIIDLPLPGRKEIGGLLGETVSFAEKTPKLAVNLTDETRNSVVDASLGLTLAEARRIFSKALLHDYKLDGKDIDLILFEKKQLIRKSGSLEYFDASETISDVGGMDSLKKWLVARQESFTPRARDYGLPLPKGLLLLGVQGCGKSLTSKAIASLWNQPLLRLDMGKIFSSFIGSSEENMRRAIATAESLAPVILWIDEIEKGFSGIKSSGATDAGVTSRIFGTFLTWMQEKTKAVFVIATANSISDLPPELLRKGRFDEIFFIDLPTEEERREIIKIHVTKRKRNVAKYNIDMLAKASEGYSGAELEMAIIESMYTAFGDKREFNDSDITQAIKESVPLSRTMAEEIQKLREWAYQRARLASEVDGAGVGGKVKPIAR
ncbi:MAG: AAA family ATPase [Nitrospinota bacterium]|nr:AAA family ATPase [Nitrospinota bacterium]